MSAGRGMPAWAPGRVAAVAPAAAAARTASAAGMPAARATASAPTNVSPAPTVSTASTRNALMVAVAVRAGQGGAVRARGDHGVPRARGDEGGGGLTRFGQAADRPAEHGGGLGFVHHQPVHAGRDDGGGVRRGRAPG